MIKSKTRCSCLQCEKLISKGDWKAKTNGFIVCGDCKMSVRVHQNDWLIELANKMRNEGFIPESEWTNKEKLQFNRLK